MNAFDGGIGKINTLEVSKSTDYWNKISEERIILNQPRNTPNENSLGFEVSNLRMNEIIMEGAAQKQARSNVIALVDDAKLNIEKITKDEISKNSDYNYADQVNKILDQIPTFDATQRQRANEAITGIDHTSLITKWYPIDVGDKGAALRAALGEQRDYDAYQAALKAMNEIGEAPVSEYMTGPYWEMSNVKAAAIVRSKKYDHVDDYAYMNAYYDDPLQFNTEQRQEAEEELSKILGNNNPKLNALNKKTLALKSEIENNNIQLLNVNNNISKLETEISLIKSSEENLKSQISKLNSDLSSKQTIIDEKSKSLGNFQKELNPFKDKINELETKKADLNKKIEVQIDLISKNTEKSKEISEETKQLEDKLNNEISKIDKEINGYKEDSKKLSTNISSLNNEIINLEQEKPELSNNISKINEELTAYGDVKAELSLLSNDQKKEIENIDLEVNKLEVELKDLISSENEINSKLEKLTNDLNNKENIIKNNNLSIAKIQSQLNPINNQIKTLESQKTSLNEQFNKDLAEISKQTDLDKNSNSSEIDKLKVNFDNQISKMKNEINSFENESKELSATVSELNQEIEIIDVENPEIINQIAKLNTELKNVIDVKADLAMTHAANLGIISSENEVNSKLKKLTNDFKNNENTIKNNSLSIAKIQSQLDPVNNQIKTLESQKTSLNEQYNKDLAEISKQTDVDKNSNSSEIDKLKANFENQISKINDEINNFENESKELSAAVSGLNQEIEIIEFGNPGITNQIAKLNTELKKFTDSVVKLENQSIIQIKGTKLMRIINNDTLIGGSGKFKAPEGTFSRGTQVYLAGAVARQQLFSVGVLDEKSIAAREEVIESLIAINTSQANEVEKKVAHDAAMVAFQETSKVSSKVDVAKKTARVIGGVITSGTTFVDTRDTSIVASQGSSGSYYYEVDNKTIISTQSTLPDSAATVAQQASRAADQAKKVSAEASGAASEVATQAASHAAKVASSEASAAAKAVAAEAATAAKAVAAEAATAAQEARAAAAQAAQAVADVAVTIDYDANFPELKEIRDAMSSGQLAAAVEAAGVAREAALDTLIALEASADSTTSDLKAAHDAVMAAKAEAQDAKNALKKAKADGR